jgi:hypothetical protein
MAFHGDYTLVVTIKLKDVLLFIPKPHRKTGTGDARQSSISRVSWRGQPVRLRWGGDRC